MENKTTFSAAKSTALIFGILAGLGGLTHGVGEVLQGNVKPDSIFVNSWTQGPIATNMGGEPGVTIVPNLLVTGILTILISVAIVAWAILGRNKRYGRTLLLLSIALLLVGGGVGPPLIGMLAGVAGVGIGAPATWWRQHLPVNARRFLAALWPWVFGVAVINGVFLTIGSVILVYFFDLNNPDLFLNSFYFSILSLLLTIFTGRAYDIQMSEPDMTAQEAV
ncbi:MAG: hypothetical protein JW953_22015 [Anaerolineae bacterium]|nr:hypothetical protein [Anaerolineae bacterium]